MRGIIDGLLHMHRHSVAHRDIHEGIVMLDEEGQPIIIDFGEASHITKVGKVKKCVQLALYTLIGRKPDKSFDLKDRERYADRDDVLGLANLIYFMMTQTVQASGLTNEALNDAANSNLISEQLRDMLSGMIHTLAHQRQSLKQVLNHRWFSTLTGTP